MTDTDIIPGADLAKVSPGAFDSAIGVDESTGALRRFALSDMPAGTAINARVATLEAGQTAGMLGYATKAAMTADLAHADGTLALVTNDATPANNGAYRKNGASGSGSWVQSADRVSGLDQRVTAAEGALDPIAAAVEPAFSIDSQFVFAVTDALNKVGLGLRPDGTLYAKFRELQFQGGEIDPTFSNTAGDLFALVDAGGRMALQITADGTLNAKVATPEIQAARGSRTDVGSRLSQTLSDYGLPKRYSWGEWYLRETRQRLRKRALGESTQLVVASIGDSWTHNRDRWTGAVAQTLQSSFGDAGAGYVSFARSGTTLPNGNIAWNGAVTYTGTWDTSVYAAAYSPDLGQATSSTAAARLTYTIAASPSAVNLYAQGGAGVVRYRFNAGAWVSVDLSALSVGLQVVALPSPVAGVFDIEVVSGSPVLFGIGVQKTTDGIRWHKLGATGTRASQWAAVDATNWKAGLVALAPNLVMILHGTNDQSAYDAAAYKGYMQTLISRVRAALPLADILLIAPCENGRANTYPMSSYAAALYELAANNKCAFLDLQYVFGESYSEYASTSARAWFNVDTIHPEPTTGGRVVVDAVLRLLTQS